MLIFFLFIQAAVPVNVLCNQRDQMTVRVCIQTLSVLCLNRKFWIFVEKVQAKHSTANSSLDPDSLSEKMRRGDQGCHLFIQSINKQNE